MELSYENKTYETSSLNLTSRIKGILKANHISALLNANFKNRLYWQAFDQEGFCQVFPILRTSKTKNFAKS